MEINPYDARLRMLQQFDGVQMQREAAPDEETAGCPGCPYFWTCPVPHRGEEVRAPQEIELEDVQHELSPRRAYRPRDESDVGWLDDGDEAERENEAELEAEAEFEEEAELDPGLAPGIEPGIEPGTTPLAEATRPRGWWNLFRRRR